MMMHKRLLLLNPHQTPPPPAYSTAPPPPSPVLISPFASVPFQYLPQGFIGQNPFHCNLPSGQNPFLLRPNGFTGQNPLHFPAAISPPPVAGRPPWRTQSPALGFKGILGRAPGIGRRRRSALQPQNLTSPTSSKTPPDVQEVRQSQLPPSPQAFQSHPQGERSSDDASFVDDASSTVEGAKPRKLQKPAFPQGAELEVLLLAVADDSEKGRQDLTSHQRQYRKTSKDVPDTVKGDIKHGKSGALLLAASQPPNFTSPCRTPTSSKTPTDVQEARQNQLPPPLQAFQSHLQGERSSDDAFFVDDASSTVEGAKPRKLQKPAFPQGAELEVLLLAVADDSEKGKQDLTSHQRQYRKTSKDVPDTVKGDIKHRKSGPLLLDDFHEARRALEINQSQPSPRMAKRQKDQRYTLEDAFTSEGGEIRERKLQKLMLSSEKNELEVAAVPKTSLKDLGCVVFGEVGNTIAEKVDHEGSFVAGPKQSFNEIPTLLIIHHNLAAATSLLTNAAKSHECYVSPAADFQDKGSQEQSQISMMKNGPSTPGGDIMQVESQELMSSVRNELQAPVLADSLEAKQAQTSNQSQPSPRKAKRQKDQVDSMENSSSTSESGEMRERKLQKLTLSSSEENELEAATLPRNYPNRDSACIVLGEVDNTVSPIALLAQKTSNFQDEADSCSLATSSILNWASTFDDVASSAVRYWGSDEKTVKVGNYYVDQKHSATMDTIIKKYGDIAKDCRYTSTLIRSSAVERVCEVVEGLRMVTLQKLSHDLLDEYSCFLKEAAEMGLNVKWLEERVDEVSNAIESLKAYKNIRDTRKGDVGKIEGLKKEIGLMVSKKRKCENEIEGLKCVLEEARLEVRKKKSAIDDIKSLRRAIPKRLLDGLY